MSKQTRPFGLAFLEEVPAEELKKINGGRRHKRHHPTSGGGSTGGGVLTTMHVSLPQPAFPQGDNG